MRRRVLVPLLAVFAASGLAVGVTATAAGAAKTPVCAGKTKKKAIAEIKKTYDTFLNGASGKTLEERAEIVEGADDPVLFQLFLDTFAANAELAASTSVKVNSVTCTGKKAADVDFDLVIAGVVSPDIAPPGNALIVDKVWKVSKGTVCDLVSLANPAVLESGPCVL